MVFRIKSSCIALCLILFLNLFIASLADDWHYKLIQKKQLNDDSCLLRFSLPSDKSLNEEHPLLPTCIKVSVPANVIQSKYNNNGNNNKDEKENMNEEIMMISKSYSPISHPSAKGYFELVVKSYPYRPGGGVGAYLCDLQPHTDANDDHPNHNIMNDIHFTSTIQVKLKSPRMMHGSPFVKNRWKHIGLIAGGTGIAPLLQIARIVLFSPSNSDKYDDDDSSTVHLLFINRNRNDILMKDEIDDLAHKYPDRFFVTYSLTREDEDETTLCKMNENNTVEESFDERNMNGSTEKDDECTRTPKFQRGRGSCEMALGALPPPKNDGSTMILVCGTDEFVASWAGPISRLPDSPDGSRGKKIQGPLKGWLAQAGYNASEVFKY